jgi:rare lipoprotein A
MDSSKDFVERGIASWYGTKFHGRRTANGEIYDMYAMTAAHKHLPIPTYVRVSNLENGRAIVVRVNDRGPFHANRVIDLSYAAAYKLGMLNRGTAKVQVQAIDPSTPRPSSPPPRPRLAGMFLQAGAFSNEDNATRLRRRLEQDLSHQVRIQAGGSDTGLFRVQVGPVPTVAQIDALAARLERLGIADTHVVID